MHLDQSSINAGLGYCRWLHSKHFNEVLHRMAHSIPKHDVGVLLSDRGKQVYQMVARHLSDQRPRNSGVFLQDAEIRAVSTFLAQGGSNAITNLAPTCAACHRTKTQAESAAARGVRQKVEIGEDGWPVAGCDGARLRWGSIRG